MIDIIEKYINKFAGKESLTIVIEGMSGSGKTTLGEELQRRYGGNLFHMDDFYLQPVQRTFSRLEEPGGNVDYERFKEEIWNHLQDKQGLSYGVYDCRKQCIAKRVQVPWARINIMEGSYSAHPYFGDRADLKFFLKVSPETQVERIRKRNGEAMLERFQKEWIPMENRYFEAFQIEEKCICFSTDV